VTPLQILILVAAAFGAGVMNAMAGGGTILTFPSLIFLGLPAITASATSTVALLPAAVASLYGFRDEVRRNQGWLKTLFLPSLIGGTIGSVLLLRTPEKVFAFLAPLLILFATALFMLQGYLSRRGPRTVNDPAELPRGRLALASLLQFGVAVYGGYFGAGIGIVMLAVLSLMGHTDIHQMNGLKNFLALCINGVAAVYFIWNGMVSWPHALVMAVGAVVGGVFGAGVARRIGPKGVRRIVIIVGFTMAISLLFRL
jgi:uncharacterized membrane protein YfcA